MVYVVVLAILVFLAGVAVVAIVGWKTLKQVNALRRSAADASRRIAEVSAELERIRPSQPR